MQKYLKQIIRLIGFLHKLSKSLGFLRNASFKLPAYGDVPKETEDYVLTTKSSSRLPPITWNFVGSLVVTLCFFSSNAIAISSDYPETEHERKLEEMGSLVGGEGFTFKAGKIRNESTATPTKSLTKSSKLSAKASCSKINQYLWQASIEVLNFIPLASSDSNGGVIITEWYSPKESKNFRFKINIFIKDTIISPDAIEVRVFEQNLKNNNWIDKADPSNLAITIEDKILRKSRELYISADRKL